MNIGNIFKSLGFPAVVNFIKNLSTKDVITYGAILVLLFIVFTQKACNKNKVKTDDCTALMVTYGDSVQIATLNSMSFEGSEVVDKNPVGDTIYLAGPVVYKEHTTFVKNWQELQDLKQKHADLARKHQETATALNHTRAELDSLNGVEVWTFTQVEELPIIETDKSETGENYEIKETIWSKGQLERFQRSIKVHPKTVTVTKTEYEYLKRHNFLAIKAGALYLDDLNNIHYTPSITYGRKWFVIEAGPVLDKDLQFEGIETKAGFVIKF